MLLMHPGLSKGRVGVSCPGPATFGGHACRI